MTLKNLLNLLVVLLFTQVTSAASLDGSYASFGLEVIEAAVSELRTDLKQVRSDSLPHNIKQHRIRKQALALRTYLDLFALSIEGDAWYKFRNLVDEGYQKELGPFKDIYDSHAKEILAEAIPENGGSLDIRTAAVADRVTLKHYKKIDKGFEKEIEEKREELLDWQYNYNEESKNFLNVVQHHQSQNSKGIDLNFDQPKFSRLSGKYWVRKSQRDFNIYQTSARSFVSKVIIVNLDDILDENLVTKTQNIGKKHREDILDEKSAEEFHELRKRLRAIFSLATQAELKELKGLVPDAVLNSDDFALIETLISKLGDFNDSLNKYLRTGKGKKKLLKKWHSGKLDRQGKPLGVREWMKAHKLEKPLKSIMEELEG